MDDELNCSVDDPMLQTGFPEDVADDFFKAPDNIDPVLGAAGSLDSGFDDEHPFPTYDELRNAGFDSDLAEHIIDRSCHHTYSEKELFHVIYESDDPLSAYNEMMHEKLQQHHAEHQEFVEDLDRFIAETDEMLAGGVMDIPSDDDAAHYNDTSIDADGIKTHLGLADCWPACKALTGSVTNNANWGFHA